MKKRIWNILFLLAFLPALTGCGLVVFGGAAAGTVAYINGELKTVLDSSLKDSVKAVDQAIRGTGVIRISREVEDNKAEYILRTTDDERIKLELEKSTAKTTNLAIRTGIFGDETLSYQILDSIKRHLK